LLNILELHTDVNAQQQHAAVKLTYLHVTDVTALLRLL